MKKELIQLLKGKNAYIQTHDFPDPDALATAFALQEYLKYYGIEATICYEGKLERASAIRMLDNFGIQVKGGQTKGALPEDACVVLVDSQNQNSNVTDIGGQKSACIDHHPVHHECEYAYRDIRKTGACATIVASYFVEDGIAAVQGGIEEQFEVHHVVDDNGAFPTCIRIPRHDDSGFGLESCGKRAGRLDQYVGIGRITRDAISVTVAASHAESDVVVRGEVLDSFEPFGLFRCAAFPFRVAGQFVEIPQRARKESTDPRFVGTIVVLPILVHLWGSVYSFVG